MKHKLFALSAAMLCLVTGCTDAASQAESAESVKSEEILQFQEDGYRIRTYTYCDPTESYTLTVLLQMATDTPGYRYAYGFCWEEEDGLTDPTYVAANRADYFSEEGDWTADDTFTDDNAFHLTWDTSGVSITFGKASGKQRHLDLAYPDRSVRTQTITQEIDDAYKPEIHAVSLTGDCYGSLERKVQVQDVYKIDVMSSELVGLVGTPLEISYYDSVSNLSLAFCYDETELRGIPEENLIVLYDQGDAAQYCEITQAEVDMAANTVTLPVAQEGIYLLADAYTWYSACGQDASAYAYEADKTAYPSDWERECDPGDILEIADIDWAIAQAPVFYIETPEQLAGVVYYSNAIADTDLTLYFVNDLDLSGYSWVPMGWRGAENHAFHIDGMGHEIANMTIDLPDETEVGFIAYAENLEASDLSFTNASVTGKNDVGIFCGVDYSSDSLSQISLQGSVQSNGTDCGAFFGDENRMQYTDCQADVLINGEPFDDSALGEMEVAGEFFTLTLDDAYCITRDEIEGYDNLTWVIYRDGACVLQRNAENETVLDTTSIGIVGAHSGSAYCVYLSAFIDGSYQRVSSKLEYTVP